MKKKTEPMPLEYLLALGATGILILSVILGLYLTPMRSIPTVATNATSAMVYGNAQAVPTFDIIQAIVAVLAAVFAIAFGFSQFIVPSIADKYSPRMLVLFKRQRSYRAAYLLVFFSMFLSVTSLLFIQRLDEWLKFGMVVGLMSLFTLGLVAFSFYYSYIYRVADPLQFSSEVERGILSSLHDSDEVRNGQAALADSAIKAITRGGEQQNVKAFLDSLTKVAVKLIQLWNLRQDESIRPSIQAAFSDISRVYQTAQTAEDAEITNYLFLKIRQIGAELLVKR